MHTLGSARSRVFIFLISVFVFVLGSAFILKKNQTLRFISVQLNMNPEMMYDVCMYVCMSCMMYVCMYVCM